MKYRILSIVLLLTSFSVCAQEISKNEKQFWEVFEKQNIELLEKFNEDGFITNNFWFYKHPIVEAIKIGNYTLVDYLISKNIKNTIEIDDSRGKDIIELLVAEKNDEGTLYILNKRVDIPRQVILSIIEKSYNIKIFELLINKIGDVNSKIGLYNEYTMLIYSILKDNDIFVNYLVKRGCDLNMPYYSIKVGPLMYGETIGLLKSPLDLLVEKNKTKLIDMFKEKNAKTVKEMMDEDEAYGKYLSKILSERNVFKFYTSSSVELKQFPRAKSFTIRKIQGNTSLYIIDQSEKIRTGDHNTLWYLICTEDGSIGWVRNGQLYYHSEM